MKLTKMSINTIITYMSLLSYTDVYFPKGTVDENFSLQEINFLITIIDAQYAYAGSYVTFRYDVFERLE